MTKSLLMSLMLTIMAPESLPTTLPPGSYLPKDEETPKVSVEARDAAMRRARVWREPAIPVERINFLEGDAAPDGFDSQQEIACKWIFDRPLGGVTPKFLCALPDGDVLKIKYARKDKNGNPEVPAEIAASRLLRGLGFGADRMYTVRTVRCFGCPSDPWSHTGLLFSPHAQVRDQFLQTFGKRGEDGRPGYAPDFKNYTDFHYVAIERPMTRDKIETKGSEGWKWKELAAIDAASGGSSRAELDGLILMAVFLQHADNKEDQQRLACLDPLDSQGRCENPVALIHDVGTTFGGPYEGLLGGHIKFDLNKWRKAPIWKDEARCLVDMGQSPTGTFKETQVSEQGRLFLTSLLNRLSDQQIYELFQGARTEEFDHKSSFGQDLNNWVEVFKARRAAISSRAPCPDVQ